MINNISFKLKNKFNLYFSDNLAIIYGNNGCGKSTFMSAIDASVNGSQWGILSRFNWDLGLDCENTALQFNQAGGKYKPEFDVTYLYSDMSLTFTPDHLTLLDSKLSEVLLEVSSNLNSKAITNSDLNELITLLNEKYVKDDSSFKFVTGESALLQFEAYGEKLDVEQLPRSFKWILLLLLTTKLLSVKKSEQLLMLDTPENGLHISWQRRIVDDIRELAGNNLQIIVATHSPSIVSGKRDSIVHMESIF
ncbi:hypothetical protein VCHA53O466_50326 [Vibrio chagasii]|nr:hypothetical protein VCHA53O466_50326 [Vibrio chagasii]